MASLFTHAFAAVALTKIASDRSQNWRVWTWAILSSAVPDADVIGFGFGIRYGDLLGHRGLSHSLLFALLWSLIIVLWVFRDVQKRSREWWIIFGILFMATASHGVLDAMTNGGLGVAFFSPFDPTRYFFPWRPIRVSPIGVTQFLNGRGLAVILSELKYVWLPLLALWLVVQTIRTAIKVRRATPSQ